MKNLMKGATAIALVMAANTASAETVLTVSTWAGPNHAMNATVFPRIGEILSECSGGDLTVKMEFGLAPPPAQYDTVRDGVADLTWIVHGYTPGKFVTTKLAELPGIPGNAESISVAYQMTQEKYLAAAGEAKGVEVLTNFVHGPGLLNTVEELEDGYKSIEGMKLRVGGGVANMEMAGCESFLLDGQRLPVRRFGLGVTFLGPVAGQRTSALWVLSRVRAMMRWRTTLSQVPESLLVCLTAPEL